MTVDTKTWKQVGKKFEAIGTQLRRLIQEANKDAVADRVAFEKALRAMLSALEDSVEAAAKVVRDPVLHREFTELAESVREAVEVTFEAARERLPIPPNGVRPKALKSGVRKPAVRKPAVRKAATKKAAATKPVAKKAPAKKAAPRKVARTGSRPAAGSKRSAS
jgi:hypothetical protein